MSAGARIEPLDARVLTMLPHNAGAGRWPTGGEIAERLEIHADVSRSCLRRLVRRGLIEDDGGLPRRYARSRAGEVELETWGLA